MPTHREVFESAQEALEYGYWCEAVNVYGARNVDFNRSSRGYGELTQMDKVADGIAYVKNAALRNISDHRCRTAIAVYYRYPGRHGRCALSYNRYQDSRDAMRNLKEAGCPIKSWMVYRWALAEWSPARTNRMFGSMRDLSKKTGIPYGTLCVWITSLDPARKSVFYLMNQWLQIGHMQAADALIANGRVSRAA